MNKSSLTAIAIPEQAKIVQETSDNRDFSRSNRIKTGTMIKWSSGTIVTGYPAGIMAFIGEGPWPWLALSFGIVSTFSAMVAFGSIFSDSARRVKDALETRSSQITPGEWKSQKTKPKNNYSGLPYHGIKISHRSRRSLVLAALHPMRPFRRILLTETIWYEPAGDYFTRECSYMDLFNWVDTKQIYAGRRRTFVQTLNSLETKPQETIEEAQEKS